MRGCVEAIAGSEQDSALGGGLAERALLFSAHQPWEGGHAALRRNPAKHVAMDAQSTDIPEKSIMKIVARRRPK